MQFGYCVFDGIVQGFEFFLFFWFQQQYFFGLWIEYCWCVDFVLDGGSLFIFGFGGGDLVFQFKYVFGDLLIFDQWYEQFGVVVGFVVWQCEFEFQWLVVGDLWGYVVFVGIVFDWFVCGIQVGYFVVVFVVYYCFIWCIGDWCIVGLYLEQYVQVRLQ